MQEKVTIAGNVSGEKYFGFFYFKKLKEKTVFSKETVKNRFGITFHNFLGKGGILPAPKMNISFLTTH